MNKLLQLLAEKKMSQADVARLTGFPRGTVSRHCKKKQLSAEAAKRYAEALEVPPGEFRPDLWSTPGFLKSIRDFT